MGYGAVPFKQKGFALITTLFVMTCMSGILAYVLRQEMLFLNQTQATLKYRSTLSEYHLVKAQALTYFKQYTKSNLQRCIEIGSASSDELQKGWSAVSSYRKSKKQIELKLEQKEEQIQLGLVFELQEIFLYDIPFLYVPKKNYRQQDILQLQSLSPNLSHKYFIKYNGRDAKFQYSSNAKSRLKFFTHQLKITRRGKDPVLNFATTNTFRFKNEVEGSGSLSMTLMKPVYIRTDQDLIWELPKEDLSFANEHSNLFVRVKGNLYLQSHATSTNIVGSFLIEGDRCIVRQSPVLKIRWTGSITCLGKNVELHGSKIQLQHIEAPRYQHKEFAFRRHYLTQKQGIKFQ